MKNQWLLLAFLVMAWLIPSISSAAETEYTFNIVSGEIVTTPARIQLSPVVREAIKGKFSIKLKDGTINFFNLKTTTASGEPFEWPKLPGSYTNGTLYAAPSTTSFDQGYQGYFDGNKITVGGLVDSRPVDGPLVEYNFSAQLITTAANVNQRAYFKIRPDQRKCVSPICGGVFVRQVNKNKTRCLDGTYKAECYVATINWDFIGNTPSVAWDQLLLYGRVVSKHYPSFGNLGAFIVDSVYEPASNYPSSKGKTFAGLKNRVVYCIKAPCPSPIEYYELNSAKMLTLAGMDLTRVKTSKNKRLAAQSILTNGNMLLAEGSNLKDKTRQRLIFQASQFYLPLLHCGSGYQTKDGQCVTPFGCVAPQIEQKIYGGAAFIDPVTGEVKSSVSTSCVAACNPPGILANAGLCNIYAP